MIRYVPTISDTERRKQDAQRVVIEGTRNGLGIRIVGGRNVSSESEDDFGIFVKEGIVGSRAASDGRCFLQGVKLL